MTNKKHTDYLAKEVSPYLYEQRNSLIRWYSWSNETLDKAKSENKLLFISVGYMACSWCNRMIKLCFKDNVKIASLLNSKFIPILVDKDENPDVDQYYSKAIHLISENSGWPLSCFALPSGHPVFGSTYIQPELFYTIAEGLYETYTTEPDKVKDVACELSKSIAHMQVLKKNHKHSFSAKDIRLITEPWKRKFDRINGGTCRPPKFPLASGSEFLLEASYYFSDSELKTHILLTLDKMATGGINDPLNGGFFRYATDVAWMVPHLEKTAADNFQLISLYCSGYKKTQRPLYKKVIEETVTFTIRELQSEQGGFYTSLLSDSEKEGAYYRWSVNEFKDVLAEDAVLAIDYYGLQSNFGFNTKAALNVSMPIDELAHRHGLTVREVSERIKQIKRLLKNQLTQRVHPGMNKVMLVSTNSLGIKALIDAYEALGNDEYMYLALETAAYIKKHFYDERSGKLYHYIKNEKAGGEAFLDGYAFTIQSFIKLFTATGDTEWLNLSTRLMDSAISNFYDDCTGMFLLKPGDCTLALTQSMPIADGALPSSGSVMASNLSILSTLLQSKSYKKITLQALYNIRCQLAGAGPFAANWARLLFHYVFDQHMIVLVGKNADSSPLATAFGYRPDVLILHVEDAASLPIVACFANENEEDSTTAYIFKNETFEFKTTCIDEIEGYMVKSEHVEQAVS